MIEAMAIFPMDFTNELPFSAAATVESAARPSDIECEVLNLFEQFRNPLLRYALSFGLPVHDAEDVTQEAFLSLFRHLQLRRSRQNLPGWLFRVTHNLALKKRHSNLKSGGAAAFDWAIAETQRDASPNPEEQMSFTQKHRQLLAVLHALPEDDQNCLRLRAEGLRYREIASVVGISLGAVSASLARSIARLMRVEGR